MATVEIVNKERKGTGTVELPASIFGAEVKTHLMHHVVTARLAAARAGAHDTKTRKDVRGGGKKPFRQKGTGRARMGTSRSPLLRGGGTVFGPHPRKYDGKVNRKEMKAALRSALSAKVLEDKIILVDDLSLQSPKTKEFLKVALALGLQLGGFQALGLAPGVLHQARRFPNGIHSNNYCIRVAGSHGHIQCIGNCNACISNDRSKCA